MPNPFFNSKKPKATTGQSSTPSTPDSSGSSMDASTTPYNMPGSTNPMAPPPSTTSMTTITTSGVEDEGLFREVYQCAKLNSEWFHVAKCVKEHPKWLLKVPEGRKWTMLHQIVFSGNVNHTKEILSYQMDNPQFSIHHKSVDDKSIRDVAQERSHVYPMMIRYIDALVATDKMIDFAEKNLWEDVIKAVQEKPDIANEKPPYKRYYLIHYLAIAGAVEPFKKINQIVTLDLNVKADDKTALDIAKEKHRAEFVQVLENLPPPPADSDSSGASGTSATVPQRKKHQYSPGFYDDISISILPPNIDFSALLPPSSSHGFGGSSYMTHHQPHHHPFHSLHHTSSVPVSGGGGGSYGGGASGGSYSSAKPKTLKPSKPKTTEEEDAAYEKSVMNNIDKVTGNEISNLITCPITKQVMRDPVIAADGFTYEHSAIVAWLENSNRSPMTNEPLENLDLKPNLGIKSLLKTLEDSGKSGSKK